MSSSPSSCTASATTRSGSTSSSMQDRDATRVCFALADHPGIFSRLAGALALVGANVVDARTYTSKDGYATAVFWVQDADGQPLSRPRATTACETMIDKTLKGEVVASRGAGGPRQDQEARTGLHGADLHHLRQRRVRDLHDHRGRHPRPARPALRPDADAGRRQRLHRLGRDRDLWRAGGRHLLRQGHVRAEIPRRPAARSSSSASCAKPSRGAANGRQAADAADPPCRGFPDGRGLDASAAASWASCATS